MPKIGWWILITGAVIMLGFGVAVFSLINIEKGSSAASLSGKPEMKESQDGLFTSKPSPDAEVQKVVRDLMYDTAGSRYDPMALIDVGFYKKLHELALNGHAAAVYDLALGLSYPNGANLSEEQSHSKIVSENLMEIASLGGDPRGSLSQAALMLYRAEHYARGPTPENMAPELSKARAYIELAAKQGADLVETKRLLALVDDLQHRDTQAFAALVGLLAAGMMVSDTSKQANYDEYTAHEAEESARLREEQKRFHCAWQGKSTDYAVYGEWAGC